MRRYLASVVVLAGLCGASAQAADLPSPDLPTKKEVVAPVLPSSWHYEITGYGWGTDLSGEAGVGPFPSSPFFINFLKLLQSPAKNVIDVGTSVVQFYLSEGSTRAQTIRYGVGQELTRINRPAVVIIEAGLFRRRFVNDGSLPQVSGRSEFAYRQ